MIEVADRLKEVREYYFSIKLREVKSLVELGKPIINLGIGSPDLQPPDEVIRELNNANIHGYQNYQGIPELRESIAKFYKKNYQVDLNFENEILPLMGSKEGILHISMAYLNKGEEVLIPNPGYPTYSAVANLMEAKSVFYNLDENNNWEPDLDSLQKQDLSKVKLMWVNYPNMPTGAQLSDDLFDKLIAFGKKNNILIVNDNPYSFILNDSPKSILSYEGAKEISLELNSLSKSFNMAGWRVGMVCGSREYINNILKVKSNMDSGMYYGIQMGAIAALNLDDNWFETNNQIYRKRREVIWKICDILSCTYDKKSVGLFVWAKVPEDRSSKGISDDLLYNYNVFITPGSIFGNKGDRYIRFSLCIDEIKINEVLKRLSKKI